MIRWLIVVGVSVWSISSLIMLVSYACAKIDARKSEYYFRIPLKDFLIQHFCPIVHTIRAIKILQLIL